MRSLLNLTGVPKRKAHNGMGTGYPIVLTADRTLIADYRLLFDGMLVAGQTTTIPPWLLMPLLVPKAKMSHGRACVAPLGLRRIEAALSRAGYTPDDVIVASPEGLSQAIGSATRLVAVSGGEPIGKGMNSSTMTAVLGGEVYPQVLFDSLMRQIHQRISDTHASASVLFGGPGAWQLADSPSDRKRLGIDHVMTGYAEGNVAHVVRGLLQGASLPAVITGEATPVAEIPPILGATTMGVVEISRGCGLGCDFCTIARTPMQHLPMDTILADVRANLQAGQRSIAILSEDFFRFGAEGNRVNPSAICELLRQLRAIESLRLIQLDHVNIISVAQLSDEELATIRALLVADTGHEYPWVNVGVESASGELLHRHGRAKMGSCPPKEWGNFCAQQLRRLCKAGFFPMVSLLLGLPDETPADLQLTRTWVQSIAQEKLSVFPVLYAPIDGSSAPEITDLTRAHWHLLRESYQINFRRIPHMYWDNQRAAGVPFWKRSLLQIMGRTQVPLWNAFFAARIRKAAS